MFGSFRSLFLLLCDQTSLRTYSLMFTNCSVFFYVRSSILGQNVMFGKFDVRTFNVRSVQNSVLLLYDQTSLGVWCSRTVQFFVMFDIVEVWLLAKLWCSESSMFGHWMFVVFEVRYFGVRSKTRLGLSDDLSIIYFRSDY